MNTPPPTPPPDRPFHNLESPHLLIEFFMKIRNVGQWYFFLIVKCQAPSATIVTGPKPEKGKQRKKRNPLRLCKLKSVGLPACTRRKKLNWSRRITDGHCLHRLVGQFRKKARLAEKKPLKGQRAQCMHSYINDFRAQLKACRVVYVGPNRWACLWKWISDKI